jgi:MFS family permease
MITFALGYGSRYSFSVFFPFLLEDFKWPRDVTAAILSLNMLFYGFTAPLAGYLVDRFGPRKTMTLGTALMSLGLLLSSLGTKPWHFYLSFGVLAGFGLCLSAAVPFTTVLKNWFHRRRGLAYSFLFCGTGGAFASYPAIAWLIHKVGWRITFIIESAIVAGVLIPLFIFILRYHPQEKGLFQDGAKEDAKDSTVLQDENKEDPSPLNSEDRWTFPAVFTNLRFWLLALITFSLWGVMDHIVVAHHIAFATDVGYSKIYASSVISLLGLARIAGSLLSSISDRIGREPTLTIGTVVGISAIAVLTSIEDTTQPWRLYYYAMGMGFGIGMCTPAITASVADILQGPKVGWIIGLIWFSYAVGGAVGPWLAGWLFEASGNYTIAFSVAIVMYAIACVAMWIVAPRKCRQPSRVGWRKNT